MTAPRQPTGWYPDPSGAPGRAVAALQPKDDPFYSYTGPPPLADIVPGTVLKTRSVPYHILGFPTLLKTTQLLYRSTSQTGNPTVNVTSVIQPLIQRDKTKVISYQSAYDSLNQNDEPSYAISGGRHAQRSRPQRRAGGLRSVPRRGVHGHRPRHRGPEGGLRRGPRVRNEHARLDPRRVQLVDRRLPSDAKVAMLGYSGGAIATEWAAELAPTYAPDVNKHMIGAAMGGVLVHPAHNLHYVEGSRVLGRRHGDGARRHRARVRDRFHAVSQRPRREDLQRHADRVDRRRSRPSTRV